MAENDAMEGKDLALEEKKEFEEKVLEAIKDLKEGQTTISIEGLEITNSKDTYIMKLRGIPFGLISKDGEFTYSKENVKQIKETLQEEGLTLEDLGLPDVEQWIDEQEKEQEREREEEQKKDEPEKDEEDLSEDLEEKEDKDKEEKEDEKQKDNKRKNLIKLNDKIFKVLIPTAKNYGGIYLDKDTGEIVGKDKKSHEIETLKGISLIKGANSSKPIHGMDNGEHKHVNAYRMYQIDNRPSTGFAVLRDGTEKGNFDVKYTTRRVDSNDINDFAYIDIPLLASQTRMGEERAREVSGIKQGIRKQGEQDKVQDELDELNEEIEVPEDVTKSFNEEMQKLPNGITSMEEFKEMLYEIVEKQLDEERPNNDSPGVHKRQAIQIVDKMVDKNEGYEQAKYELYNERPKEMDENEKEDQKVRGQNPRK